MLLSSPFPGKTARGLGARRVKAKFIVEVGVFRVSSTFGVWCLGLQLLTRYLLKRYVLRGFAGSLDGILGELGMQGSRIRLGAYGFRLNRFESWHSFPKQRLHDGSLTPKP